MTMFSITLREKDYAKLSSLLALNTFDESDVELFDEGNGLNLYTVLKLKSGYYRIEFSMFGHKLSESLVQIQKLNELIDFDGAIRHVDNGSGTYSIGNLKLGHSHTVERHLVDRHIKQEELPF